MKLYIADGFAQTLFSGNQAGVGIVGEEPFPEDTFMQKMARELGYSETAFVKKRSEDIYEIRYFTPEEEVPLCGHATIATFAILRDEGYLDLGRYKADTKAGLLEIEVTLDCIWMDMAAPEEFYTFTLEESQTLYEAFGLTNKEGKDCFLPKIVSTGLRDILLPVKSKEILDGACMNAEKVTKLSKHYAVVGVHMFYYSEQETCVYCRNFAPLYGIDEESATGTSNGALTYYLWKEKKIIEGQENVFVQGEAMGRRSEIRSKILIKDGKNQICIGGNGVIVIK